MLKPVVTLYEANLTVTAGTSWLAFSHDRLGTVRTRSTAELSSLARCLSSWLGGFVGQPARVELGGSTPFAITCRESDIFLERHGDRLLLGCTVTMTRLLGDLRDWLALVTGQESLAGNNGDTRAGVAISAGHLCFKTEEGNRSVRLDRERAHGLTDRLLQAAQGRSHGFCELGTEALELRPLRDDRTMLELTRNDELQARATLSPAATVRLAMELARTFGTGDRHGMLGHRSTIRQTNA